jgi:hypothetical protein
LTTLPPSCAVVRRSGNLNFLEPSGPLQACNGTALPFKLLFIICSEESALQYIKHLQLDKALLTFLLLIQIYKAGDFLRMKIWKVKYVINLICALSILPPSSPPHIASSRHLPISTLIAIKVTTQMPFQLNGNDGMVPGAERLSSN